jgi:hypothetical protein
MYYSTYCGVSLLCTEYFRALLTIHNLRGGFGLSLAGRGYDIEVEENEGGFETYTITVCGREHYDLMQKVFSAANG